MVSYNFQTAENLPEEILSNFTSIPDSRISAIIGQQRCNNTNISEDQENIPLEVDHKSSG